MKLLFLGSRGAQSIATLEMLLENDRRPMAVLMEEDGDPSEFRLDLPVIGTGRAPGLPELAAARGIPAFTLSRASLSRYVRKLQPDRVLVSCYPYRILETLLESVPRGWVNIHPSLLPDYRGPSPLFWQLRDGCGRIGVTLHAMSPELDLGPIIGQRAFTPSDGTSMTLLSRRAGGMGGQLYLEWEARDTAGGPPARVQHPSQGSRQPYPGPEDFRLDPRWGARRVFNFVKGVRELGPPFFEIEAGRRCLVADALSWHAGPGPYPMDETEENTRLLHCYNGAVMLQTQGNN